MADRLPSWRPGPHRDAILDFLDRSADVPVDEKVAYLDNDGTMWCEKPTYVQLDFMVHTLQEAVAQDASLAERPEFDAVLSGDQARIAEVGMVQVAGALAALLDGKTPQEFAATAEAFLEAYRHRTLGSTIQGVVYQPMLELIEELRAHDFAVGIVTGGGTEFVREVSRRLYGVEPGMVVGTMIGYEFTRDDQGRPLLHRTMKGLGSANEGGAKVAHIQSQVGRQPLVAVGNSSGDREMLEWAQAHPRGGLAVLVDHDDAEREFAYEGKAATFEDDEAITDVAARLGWVVVSMRDDWETVWATP